jgi:hypothetical protein
MDAFSDRLPYGIQIQSIKNGFDYPMVWIMKSAIQINERNNNDLRHSMTYLSPENRNATATATKCSLIKRRKVSPAVVEEIGFGN